MASIIKEIPKTMLRPFLLFSILFLLFNCEAPEQEAITTQWYKGNLHTHSLWSDGDDYPEMIMQWYKDHDYHFIGLSDHNILQEGEKWVSVPNNAIRQNAFQEYLQEWGEEWVNYREDTSGIQVQLKTLEEYCGKFEVPGEFLIIKCEEITDRYEDKPVHLNATNLKELIPPAGGNNLVEVLQNNIDAVMAQREATGQPMIVHINHPNFGWAMTAEDIMVLKNERFFEVYNGHPAVNNYGDSTRLGTEAMWDKINAHYSQIGQPLLYGLAVDDSHNYHNLGLQYSNAGRGWIMVNATDLQPESLIEALENGQFYASTGVELENYDFDGKEIQLSVKAEEGVQYQIQFIGLQEGASSTSILQESEGIAATYTFKGNEQFVRAAVISDQLQKNPFNTGDVEKAWGQPEVMR